MRKYLILYLLLLLPACNHIVAASTPFKCLYAVAEVVPAGSGKVYLDTSDGETDKYLLEKNYDFSDTGFLKAVFAEDGSESNSQGCNANKGIYECRVYVEPNDDYVLVCYANKLSDNGRYAYANCYSVIRGEGEKTFSFNYSGEGDRININNSSHGVDGNSADGPSREILCDEQHFSEEPDTRIYAILKRFDWEYPKVVKDATGVERVVMDKEAEQYIYNLSGQRVGCNAKGIVIRNGRKVIIK